MPKPQSRAHAVTRRALPAALSVAVLVAVSAGAATAASAAGQGSGSSTVTVPQGASSVPLSSGTVLGDTPANTPVDISIILQARNRGQLDSAVQQGWKGPFLTTRQFAAQYGQSPQVISAIESYLNHFGITTSAYADGLDISANGTAGEIDKAFSVSLQNFRIRGVNASNGRPGPMTTVHGSIRDPRVPSSIGSPILAILGLSNYAPFSSTAVAATGHRLNRTSAAAGSGIPAGNGLAPQDFVNDYNLSPLESHGAQGQGETVGIVTLASLDPNVPLAFWNNVLGLNEPASRLKIVTVDGGAGAISTTNGSEESDLDVEQSGAIAPKANVRVYVAPNSDPGFADGFFAAASDNIADSVSASWGESETYIDEGIANATEPAAYAQVFDEAFAEFAAQGQSDFTSSADYGAYTAVEDAGTTNLAVDNPGDSPYITSAGGTTLPGEQTYGVFDADGNLTGTESVTIPAERAWGWDYLWPLFNAFGAPDEASVAESFIGGDGGGYSTIEPRPSYQNNISTYNDRQYLTGTDVTTVAPGINEPTEFSYNPTPSLRTGVAFSGRGEPDVSTNADPQTGYAVYDPNLFAPDTYAQYGGTSFVAPQLNGSTAVIDSFLHHRIGLWNPAIYKFASSHNSPFTPLNDTTVFSGIKYLSQTDAEGNTTALAGNFTTDNLYYTGRPGTTWNPASGLGTPNLTELAQDFAQQH
jgi:kumamolisin